MPNLPVPILYLILRLTRRKRRFHSAEALAAAVRRDRARNDGAPPAELAQRLFVLRADLDGRNCYVLAPRPGAKPGAPIVLYLHGGAYCTAMSKWHWRMLAELVEASGCVVHVPLYPLAPEHTHRDALPMVRQLYGALCTRGGRDGIVLMGDSAGGNLALVLAQCLAEHGLPQPRDLVLISPWLDLTTRLATTAARYIDDPWLALPGMRAAAAWWSGGDDPAMPWLSPLHGSLAGLGRMTLFIGTRDLLLAECRALRLRAQREGIGLRWIEAPGLPHVWPLLPLARSAAARRCIAEIVRGEAVWPVAPPSSMPAL